MKKVPVDLIRVHFACLPDPRVDRTQQHELINILVIALCACVAGADSSVQTEEFGRTKLGFFRSFLDLSAGDQAIPSHDTFSRVSVVRGTPPDYPPAELEPGVKFFVLMLEQLGAKPLFSCEGHPQGFYIAFNAPYELVVGLDAAGYFFVTVWGPNRWRMTIRVEPCCDKRRDQTLKWDAEAWVDAFGPLAVLDQDRPNQNRVELVPVTTGLSPTRPL